MKCDLCKEERKIYMEKMCDICWNYMRLRRDRMIQEGLEEAGLIGKK